MLHRWIIKRYKDDPLLVSQTVAEACLAAWEAGTPVIKLPGNVAIAGSSISAIEETTEVDDLKQLGTGLDIKSMPLEDLEGNIVTGWYKKNISVQEWERKLSHQPHYHKLVDSDGTIWAAMRLVEFTVNNRSPELVACDEAESKLLDGYSQ